MSLDKIDYQPVVDCLIRLGDQLNKPAYRFLKGEVIALSLEKATGGRLKYVDEEGYDAIDLETNIKYEYKSTTEMFKNDTITGRVSLSNTNKENFEKTFDYLLCIQSNPSKFAIARMTWDECSENYNTNSKGQFNLNRGIIVNEWICRDKTIVNDLEPVRIDIRKLLESVI